PSVTWSVDNGTIDQSGNYTAPGSPATATVKATSNQDVTKFGTTTITVTGPPEITSVTASCIPSIIQPGQMSRCAATVTGTGNFDPSVTWSVDNGTIDQSGNYTAPGSPATATVKATSNQDV